MSEIFSSEPSWQLFPHLVIRTTGFPFELVERLRSQELLLLTRQVQEIKIQLEELRHCAPKLHHPNRKALSSFNNGKPIPGDPGQEGDWLYRWNAAALEKVKLEQELQSVSIREIERLRSAFPAIVSDPRILEAIASTSPGVYRDIVRGKFSLRMERQIALYIQRFSTKNETISFFGPINYGICDVDSNSSTVNITWNEPLSLLARRAHPAAWLVRGLIDEIAFSPTIAPWLVLSRRTFARTDSLHDPSLLHLINLVDGAMHLRSLSEKMHIPLEETIILARKACRTRFVTHQLEIPAACESPLEDLVRRLAGFPLKVTESHMENLQKMRTLISRFSCADAAGKVLIYDELLHEVATCYQIQAPTSAPQFYGDRQPIREECIGTLEIRISGERARELETRVRPSLTLLTGVAIRTQKAANRAVAHILGTRTVPFLQALVTCSEHHIPFDTQLIDTLTRHISDATVHELSLENLSLPAVPVEESAHTVCSVDLMIGAKSPEAWASGDYEIIMSDVHDTAQVWGWALQFHQQRESVQTAMTVQLARLGNHVPMVNCLASRRTGLPPAEFPGPIVEIGGVSMAARPWLLPVDDLWVESDGQTARLCSRSLNSEIILWNGELESLFHTAFALPRIRPLGLSLGAHTPRLLYYGTVLQREQWQLDTNTLSDLFHLSSLEEKLAHATEVWDRYHLPERVFIKFPQERKPIYIDLASPHLLAVFDPKRQENPYVAFSEMRPCPEQLWLHSPAGSHTAELRCTFVL